MTINGACLLLKPSAVPGKKEVGINKRKNADSHVGGVNTKVGGIRHY